ncbi:response regulator [Candidatus Berkelbacteria bacterium]|nr:response regulator [Candidatus Berkelbacteria bacterium]
MNQSVLLIEDCEEWREMFLSRLLAVLPVGVDVVAPTTAAETRQALAERQYAVLFLDESLGGEGWENLSSIWDLQEEVGRQLEGGARAFCASSDKMAYRQMVQYLNAEPSKAWSKRCLLKDTFDQERRQVLLPLLA